MLIYAIKLQPIQCFIHRIRTSLILRMWTVKTNYEELNEIPLCCCSWGCCCCCWLAFLCSDAGGVVGVGAGCCGWLGGGTGGPELPIPFCKD